MAAERKSLSGRQFRAILKKDIVMELRTFEMLTSMGLYTLLTMVVYFVALAGAGQDFDVRKIAAGLIWLAFVFTSLLGLNRSLVHEHDQGVLDALLLSPIDRPVIFFAKAAGNFIFITIVEALSVPVFYFLFLQGKGFGGPLWMLPLSIVAASIGLSGIGTFLATMSVNSRGKDVLLAVLLIPLIYPLLLGAVSAASSSIVGGPHAFSEFWQAMGFIGGFDVIMLLASFGLYEFIVGA
ncbi:MAG TPA: heme exporter protein CcmB [Coriobacteriia bacterium]|jgi:heme exporter protein B